MPAQWVARAHFTAAGCTRTASTQPCITQQNHLKALNCPLLTRPVSAAAAFMAKKSGPGLECGLGMWPFQVLITAACNSSSMR